MYILISFVDYVYPTYKDYLYSFIYKLKLERTNVNYFRWLYDTVYTHGGQCSHAFVVVKLTAAYKTGLVPIYFFKFRSLQ